MPSTRETRALSSQSFEDIDTLRADIDSLICTLPMLSPSLKDLFTQCHDIFTSVSLSGSDKFTGLPPLQRNELRRVLRVSVKIVQVCHQVLGQWIRNRQELFFVTQSVLERLGEQLRNQAQFVRLNGLLPSRIDRTPYSHYEYSGDGPPFIIGMTGELHVLVLRYSTNDALHKTLLDYYVGRPGESFILRGDYHVAVNSESTFLGMPWDLRWQNNTFLRLRATIRSQDITCLTRCPRCKSPNSEEPLDLYFQEYECLVCQAMYCVHVDMGQSEVGLDVWHAYQALHITLENTGVTSSEIEDELEQIHRFMVLFQPNTNASRMAIDALHQELAHNTSSTRRSAKLHTLRKLCTIYDELPRGLFVRGITCDVSVGPISAGGFACIYIVTMQNGSKVALKILRFFQDSSADVLLKQKRRFAREALIWSHAGRHPHILPFIGVDDSSFRYGHCMVLPWMKNGNIFRYLLQLKEEGQILNYQPQVDRWIVQIIDGLRFLHEMDIIHADLRAANILLDDDLHVRLADFGLSAISDLDYFSIASITGRTPNWLSPELLDPSTDTQPNPTKESDVYAFGCVCIELYTGRRPYDGMNLFALYTQVSKGHKPPWPKFYDKENMGSELWKLVTLCLSSGPEDRPSAEVAFDCLKDMFPDWGSHHGEPTVVAPRTDYIESSFCGH